MGGGRAAVKQTGLGPCGLCAERVLRLRIEAGLGRDGGKDFGYGVVHLVLSLSWVVVLGSLPSSTRVLGTLVWVSAWVGRCFLG